MSDDRHANGRLDSWKEIAAYLNRDVRTVIRWESKGLPVHRVPGGKRQAVFAYPAEIDHWLISERVNNGGSDQPDESLVDAAKPEAALQQPTGPAVISSVKATSAARHLSSRNHWLVAIACASILLAGWTVYAVLSPGRRSATIHPISLKQLTDNGRIKSNLRTDGTTLYFTETEGARSVLASAPVSGGSVRHIKTPFSNVALQDLSKDGKNLLLTAYDGIAVEGPLWTMSTGGGDAHQVGDVICNFARWSPDNRRIACADKTTIAVMNSDGSDAHTVASFLQPVNQIAWAPDGNHLRYLLDDTTAHTTSEWEMEVGPNGAANDVHQLHLGHGCCVTWTWTRDGGAFVYTLLDSGGNAHLMIQTGQSPAATELPMNIGLSELAPGSREDSLYVTVAGSFRGELLKFDVKQKELQTFLPGISGVYVAYSPDRQWITYSKTQDYSLWRSRADGSDALELVKPPTQVQVSSWSPDGRQIAFMAQVPGKPFRIYLIGRDGGPVQEAAEGDDNQGGPSWFPDGKVIVYGNVFCEKTQNCWIRRLDLAKRKAEILPGSKGLRTARWSPDGKYIAALRFETRELMLFDIRKQTWRVLADSVSGDNINWSSDSQYVYVDSPRDEKPIIEKVHIADGHRRTVVSLAALRNVPGTINTWVGLSPDNSPILAHIITTSEIYEMGWTDH
jgi:Tol biopolymer transport system component